MAGTWAADRFEPAAEPLRRYVEKHRQLDGEPLHLALVYEPGPGRDPDHYYLLEVIGGLAADIVSPDRELFDVSYSQTHGFVLPTPGAWLHMTLTNPKELALATRDAWPAAQEIASAVRSGNYQVLHADEVGDRLLAGLGANAGQPVHG